MIKNLGHRVSRNDPHVLPRAMLFWRKFVLRIEINLVIGVGWGGGRAYFARICLDG